MTWLKCLGIAVAALVVLGAIVVVYYSWRWEQGTRSIWAKLEEARFNDSARNYPARYDVRELAGLPAPVQRYFRAVLNDRQPIITAVSMEQVGTFNMSESAEQWKPFTAKQRVITQIPGFDWDARIMMFPFVPVHIHDAYIAGHGMLRGAIFGLIPVVNMPDDPALQRGEFMRYFMEALWYPTALLPSQGVRWEPVDDQSARATITSGAITQTLIFHFQQDGLIDSARAEARSRMVNGVLSEAPWHGRFWNYAIRDGVRIPLEGEVAWVMPDGTKPYYRGKVTALSYEFVSQP